MDAFIRRRLDKKKFDQRMGKFQKMKYMRDHKVEPDSFSPESKKMRREGWIIYEESLFRRANIKVSEKTDVWWMTQPFSSYCGNTYAVAVENGKGERIALIGITASTGAQACRIARRTIGLDDCRAYVSECRHAGFCVEDGINWFDGTLESYRKKLRLVRDALAPDRGLKAHADLSDELLKENSFGWLVPFIAYMGRINPYSESWESRKKSVMNRLPVKNRMQLVENLEKDILALNPYHGNDSQNLKNSIRRWKYGNE